MPKRVIDLIGQRFGKLMVVERATPIRVYPVRWTCFCDCDGNRERPLALDSACLRRGTATSCGCVKQVRADDMTDQRFGRWVVLSRASAPGETPVYWLCRCSCPEATERAVDGKSLRRSMSTSCGCFQREDMSRRKTKHGRRRRVGRGHDQLAQRSPAYSSWSSMNSRCSNPNDHAYASYGGRGVTVYDRWRGPDGFNNFLEDMGERPVGKTIHRNNDALVYCKDNCSWEPDDVQARHRRGYLSNEARERVLARLAQGDRQVDIAKRFGVGVKAIWRIKHGRQDAYKPGSLRAHQLYSTWTMMRRRCRVHVNYAGRGITVCPRWHGEGGFQRFLDDVGERPSPDRSIDRIDNDGNYCVAKCGGLCGHDESNVRWATREEQMLNRRGIRKFTVDETQEIVASHNNGEPMSSIGRRYSVSYHVVRRVLHYVGIATFPGFIPSMSGR